MTDIVERLGQMPSSLNDACRTMEEAKAEIERLRDLVQTLLDNDPDEPIADNGVTVLDGWRDRARRLLEERPRGTLRCQRCGSSGDTIILCAGCQQPLGEPK